MRKPALKRQDWDSQGILTRMGAAKLNGECLSTDEMSYCGEERHALAALALHGQPFGFTWDDVDDLREIAPGFHHRGDGQVERALLDLADRIAALLPPREAA